jgi:hypothetical protein
MSDETHTLRKDNPFLISSPSKPTKSQDMEEITAVAHFRTRAWLNMLHHLELPPYNPHPQQKLQYNIQWILGGGFLQKVPELVCVVTEFTSDIGDCMLDLSTSLCKACLFSV